MLVANLLLTLGAIVLLVGVLFTLEHMESRIMAKIDELTAAVVSEKTVEDSAIALLTGLSQQLKDALASGNTDAAVQTVIDSLASNTAALSAAVVANTPPPAPAV